MKYNILKLLLLFSGLSQMTFTAWAMDHNGGPFDMIVEDTDPFAIGMSESGWEDNYWDYALTYDPLRKNDLVNQELAEIDARCNDLSNPISKEEREKIYARLVELSQDPDIYWSTNLSNKFLRARLTLFSGPTPMGFDEVYNTFAQVTNCQFIPEKSRVEALYALAYMRFTGKNTQLSWDETVDIFLGVHGNSCADERIKINALMFVASIRYEKNSQKITDQQAFKFFRYAYNAKSDGSSSKAACAYFMGMLIVTNRYPDSSYMEAYKYFDFASLHPAFNKAKSLHATLWKAMIAERQGTSILSGEALYNLYQSVSENPNAPQIIKNKAMVRMAYVWNKYRSIQITAQEAFDMLEPTLTDPNVQEEATLIRTIISFTDRLYPRGSDYHYKLFSTLADNPDGKIEVRSKAKLYKLVAGLSIENKLFKFSQYGNELRKMYVEYSPQSTSKWVAGLGLLYIIAENKVIFSEPQFPLRLRKEIFNNPYLPSMMKDEATLLGARLALKDGFSIEACKNAYDISQKCLLSPSLPADLKVLAERNMQDLVNKIALSPNFLAIPLYK